MFKATIRPVNDIGEIECRVDDGGDVLLTVREEFLTIHQRLTVSEAKLLAVLIDEAACLGA
jgi:hypothetical protein